MHLNNSGGVLKSIITNASYYKRSKIELVNSEAEYENNPAPQNSTVRANDRHRSETKALRELIRREQLLSLSRRNKRSIFSVPKVPRTDFRRSLHLMWTNTINTQCADTLKNFLDSFAAPNMMHIFQVSSNLDSKYLAKLNITGKQ